MFNPFGMGKDLKGMEKMVKPALEKFMKDSGFVKKDELEQLIAKVENDYVQKAIDLTKNQSEFIDLRNKLADKIKLSLNEWYTELVKVFSNDKSSEYKGKVCEKLFINPSVG